MKSGQTPDDCGLLQLGVYNTKRPHQGRCMKGRTPLQAFRDGILKPQKEEPETNLNPAA